MTPGRCLVALVLLRWLRSAAALDRGDGKGQLTSRIEPTTWTVALHRQSEADTGGLDLATAAKGLAAGLATGALCDRLLLLLGGSCAPTTEQAPALGRRRLRAPQVEKASPAQIALAATCGAAALALSALVGAGCAARKERATRSPSSKKVKAMAVGSYRPSSRSSGSTGTQTQTCSTTSLELGGTQTQSCSTTSLGLGGAQTQSCSITSLGLGSELKIIRSDDEDDTFGEIVGLGETVGLQRCESLLQAQLIQQLQQENAALKAIGQSFVQARVAALEAPANTHQAPLEISQNLLIKFQAESREPALPRLPPVQVCARVRPLLPGERAEGAASTALDLRTGISGSVVVKSGHLEETRRSSAFHFDAVLGPEDSQEDVWEQTQLSCLVGRVVAGCHATVLAYGQTGTGKTYTVEGALERSPAARRCAQSGAAADVGLVPRAVRELFEQIAAEAAEAPESTFAVKMSFLQIYKERIYDLLLPPKSDDAGLRLRQDPALGQFYAEGLTEVECADADTVFRSYSAGLQQRNVAATTMNTHSSRSHAILSLAVTRSSPVGGKACGVRQEVKSLLTFVDLAGSERACADASRMQEAANINQSLFVLRKVVACLTGERCGDFGRAQQSGTRRRRQVPGSWSLSASTGQLCQEQTSREARHEPESPATQHRRMIGEGEHVPFRESKLTSLLQHAFGGNSFLLMIACLSPLDQNFDENLSTLKYAAQTMNIRNEPVVNLEPKDQLIQELQRENAALKARAARLS